MQNELKHCPFCGGKADLIKSPTAKKYHPCCHNEKCIMFVGGMWYKTKEQAIDEWNRMADNG